MIEVLNTIVSIILWHFNSLPITTRVEFISQNLNRVVAAFYAFDLAVLIESQPLDLDLDVHDQIIQILVDTSVDRTSTSIEVALSFQRRTLFVC